MPGYESKQEYLVSVIVPVYNGEKFIKGCIESIQNQSYYNIEIIIINDGSNDQTGQIVFELARQDERMKYVCQENKGLSEARNVGLDMAIGDYISFVDADDYIDTYMIESMLRILNETQTDLGICGFESVPDHSNNHNCSLMPDYKVVTSYEALENINGHYSSYNIYGVEAWNKLYKRALFEGIRFPKGKYYEDNFIMHEIYDKAKKVVYVYEKYYYYVKTEGSITNSPYSDKKFEGLEGFEKRISFFEEKYSALVQNGILFYLKVLRQHYYTAKVSKQIYNMKRIKSKYNSYYRRIYRKKITISRESLANLGFFISPWVFEECIHFLNHNRKNI